MVGGTIALPGAGNLRVATPPSAAPDRKDGAARRRVVRFRKQPESVSGRSANGTDCRR